MDILNTGINRNIDKLIGTSSVKGGKWNPLGSRVYGFGFRVERLSNREPQEYGWNIIGM